MTPVNMPDHDKSFFAKMTKSYEQVPTKSGIETEPFLEATENLIKLFDLLGPTTFLPVKSDMLGNVKKIRNKFLENKEKHSTLQSIVKSEQESKEFRATDGMLWLKRGLEFTALALRHNIDNPNQEMSQSFTRSYEQTLKKHHNFVIKQIFSVMMKACPSRIDFYSKMGQDEKTVITKLVPWLAALEEILKILCKLFVDNGLEK